MKKYLIFFPIAFLVLYAGASSPKAESASTDVFYEIQDLLKSGQCFSIAMTANVVNNNGRNNFTQYGLGELRSQDYQSNRIVAVFEKVSFSDRSFFAGNKDKQTIEIFPSGNEIQIRITLNSWSNGVLNLDNVTASKDRYGYYLTCHTTDNAGAVLYIFSIYNRRQCVGTSSQLSDRCRLKPDPGNCKANATKYYYDSRTGKCRAFSWGGCGGVVPFHTLQECRNACGG